MRFFLFSASVLMAQASLACVSYELEFIGSVRNVQRITTANSAKPELCTYQIETHQYWENSQCPLSPGELDSALLTDADCKLKDGDPISGVASLIDDKITID